MRIRRSILVALLALTAAAHSAAAQLSWDIENFQTYVLPYVSAPGYRAGFTATVLLRNINSYADPDIVTVRGFSLFASDRVRDFCSTWGMLDWGCDLLVQSPMAGLRIRGNVQTGTLPVGSSFYAYAAGWENNSCTARQCYWQGYRSSPSIGLMGCQGPAPMLGDSYSGRTCDEDGYDGSLFLNIDFRYETSEADDPGAVPRFEFRESDVTMYAFNEVRAGPNAFVHATPEPSTWVLLGTGLMFVWVTARRRALPGA